MNAYPILKHILFKMQSLYIGKISVGGLLGIIEVLIGISIIYVSLKSTTYDNPEMQTLYGGKSSLVGILVGITLPTIIVFVMYEMLVMSNSSLYVTLYITTLIGCLVGHFIGIKYDIF